MEGVQLVLAVHNHQPVGNFEGVFETAYQTSYLPFLDVLGEYSGIPFSLHMSGPLLDWLEERHPEYVERVRGLARAGRVEILGGGYYEPILTMIPHRDRVGQIRSYSERLEEVFGARVRGIWVPERVWEQQLTSALVEAGIEYTVLDDYHFQSTGLGGEELSGYFLTEDDGHLLKVFPNSERLRYLIPFKEPHETYLHLRELAEKRPGCTVVFGDDGEKFGSWPDTHEHVYAKGWLRRFCDMIEGNRDWLSPVTFSRAVDNSLPRGKVYLPDSSYREMSEWTLPSRQFQSYMKAVRDNPENPAAEVLRPYLRPGGSWRNFKAKYPESDEMYARMLGVSKRLAGTSNNEGADPDYVEAARLDLYRGQCNCPYWHGAFGGLYLPHLRNAIYRNLISAENALDEAEGRSGEWARLDVDDFNLDARKEVRLENDRFIAFIRPALGGHVYELDVRHALVNLLATLDRREEAYHRTVLAACRGDAVEDGRASVMERVVLKQEKLNELLVYDRRPRKALVDHFFEPGACLDALALCQEQEAGDFATGTYLAQVQRGAGGVNLMMERPGMAMGHLIVVRKTLRVEAGNPSLLVTYELSDLPAGVELHFGVEINLAGMAGHAEDRYYQDQKGRKLGPLDSRLDLEEISGIELRDEWLDLSVRLGWTEAGGLWAFPVSTVSQSESGFEGVYQSSTVIPHWRVRPDSSGRWTLRLSWTMERATLAASGTPWDVPIAA